MKNPQSNFARFFSANRTYYGDKNNDYYDNHRCGMMYTSTLWRIRKKMGPDNADKLVAQTILDLNKYIEKRPDFYNPTESESLPDKIEWYDFFYGLIQKDKELFNGDNIKTIINEFEKTGFPITLVKY